MDTIRYCLYRRNLIPSNIFGIVLFRDWVVDNVGCASGPPNLRKYQPNVGFLFFKNKLPPNID